MRGSVAGHSRHEVEPIANVEWLSVRRSALERKTGEVRREIFGEVEREQNSSVPAICLDRDAIWGASNSFMIRHGLLLLQ